MLASPSTRGFGTSSCCRVHTVMSDEPPVPGSPPELEDESPRGRKRYRTGEFSGDLTGEKEGLVFNSINKVSLSFLF